MRLLLLLLLGVGCADVTAPDPLPPNAIVIAPLPALYAQYWAQIEQCSGKSRDMAGITFYRVGPSDQTSFISPRTGREVEGLYQEAYGSHGERILIAGAFLATPDIIRHEMLHAVLTGIDGHPPEYFTEKCGSLVAH